MRRLALVLAAAGLLAIPATAQAAPTAYGDPYAATIKLFANCPPTSGVTFKGTLIRQVKQTPSGPLNEITGQELFVITCQPLQGSVTLQLQFRSGNTWVDAADPARFNFPTKVRGFGLLVGPWVCQGLKTSWRLAIFSSGISGDGSVWGPQTDFDPLIGGANGKYFNCG